MLRAEDLANLLAPPSPPTSGVRQAILTEWDPLTGANTVNLGGTLLSNLPTLAASTLVLAAGDVVLLTKYNGTFYITGRVAPAGSGSLAIRSATVTESGSTTSSEYVDLDTPGPILDVYIGPSRKCVVMLQTAIAFVAPCYGAMGFYVRGASTIDNAAREVAYAALTTGSPNMSFGASVGSTTILTVDDGLNEGLNTFHCTYARLDTGTGGSAASFANRSITVIPF